MRLNLNKANDEVTLKDAEGCVKSLVPLFL